MRQRSRQPLGFVHFLCHAFAPSGSAFASDIVWEVQSPFRFFKKPSAFALHEKAFEAARGKADAPLPGNIVWRTERRAERSGLRRQIEPGALPATARKGYRALAPRLGRADARSGLLRAQFASVPLSAGVRPAVFLGHGEGRLRPPRRPHGGRRRFRPSVSPTPAPASAPSRGRRAPAAPRARAPKQSCKNKLRDQARALFADAASPAAPSRSRCPTGASSTENVAVEDVLVVAMGDSFMSGESNPDRPVTFSPRARWSTTRRWPMRAKTAPRRATSRQPRANNFGLASTDAQFDPKSLPRRKMEDEERA